ncbi:MAG TPA: RsmD family RNA methyltransferase, partial [Xanthomonadales bacterium]|nr:RsmD family RNA methyltransferase [Xanthomonadales bacterium]
ALAWLAMTPAGGAEAPTPFASSVGASAPPTTTDPAAVGFDIVFVDPPFGADLWRDSCAALESHGWLAPNALIYVESPRALAPEVPPAWRLYREGFAGDVRYALYRAGAD